VKYLAAFNPDECKGHERRFALTLEWLEPLLIQDAAVFDFGADMERNVFDVALRRLFPQIQLRNTSSNDLRLPLPIVPAIADGVLVMEVLEHMKDRPTDPVDTLCYTGVRTVLQEALRLLKPGGWMFLSTPNASQYGTAWRLVRGGSTSWCEAHQHEFGWHELLWWVTNTGFVIERAEAVNVWEELECPQELRDVMDRLCPDMPRGHCSFILARKPGGPPDAGQ